MANSVCARRRC